MDALGRTWQTPPVGQIRSVNSTKTYALDGHSLVGRAAHCHVALPDTRVSSEHASLSWRDTAWAIRDLGSTNGTWVNGQRIAPGVDVKLREGSEIAFGEAQQGWALDDASPPGPIALPVAGGEGCPLRDGVIAVPDSDQPQAMLYRSLTGSWMLENGNRITSITPGSIFEVGETSWRFSCPTTSESTVRTRHRLVIDGTFHFDVSTNEEEVSLSVELEHERLPMGQLSGFYLLLTLARLRMQAEESGADAAERGWVHRDQLLKMLACGEQQLNVWVHRIRSRFAAKGFLDYADVVQRRDGSGQMRIGSERIVVRRV
jgi:hypothetical protein